MLIQGDAPELQRNIRIGKFLQIWHSIFCKIDFTWSEAIIWHCSIVLSSIFDFFSWKKMINEIRYSLKKEPSMTIKIYSFIFIKYKCCSRSCSMLLFLSSSSSIMYSIQVSFFEVCDVTMMSSSSIFYFWTWKLFISL